MHCQRRGSGDIEIKTALRKELMSLQGNSQLARALPQ